MRNATCLSSLDTAISETSAGTAVYWPSGQAAGVPAYPDCTVPLATDAGFLRCIVIGCQHTLHSSTQKAQDSHRQYRSRCTSQLLGPAAASTFGVFTADLCLFELGVPCTRARLEGVSITVA
jgi:hypothetical protein